MYYPKPNDNTWPTLHLSVIREQASNGAKDHCSSQYLKSRDLTFCTIAMNASLLPCIVFVCISLSINIANEWSNPHKSPVIGERVIKQ